MGFRDKWTDGQKRFASIIAGSLLAQLAIFITVAVISYLFHWKEDMSLYSGAYIQEGIHSANAAGKLGLRAGAFFFGECFGFGIFALIAFLVIACLRIFGVEGKNSILKNLLVWLGTAILASCILAFVGKLAGLGNLFGCGPGGKSGAWLIEQSTSLMGPVVTGLALVVVLLCFLMLCSEKFAAKAGGILDGKGITIEPPRRAPAAEPAGPVAEPAVAETVPDVVEAGFQESESGEAVEDTAPNGGYFPGLGTKKGGAPKGKTVADGTGGNSKPANEGEGPEVIKSGEELTTSVTEELKPYDNRMDPPEGLPKFKFPTLDLLQNYSSGRRDVGSEELARNNNKIRAVLGNYKIQIDDVKAIVGPTVTLYKVYPSKGVKISSIKNLQEDIAISLGARGVRVVPLSDSVGIEVANDTPSIVPLKALLNSEAFHTTKADLPVAIGYTITREVKVFDLADAPHLLIAGATKQGKSVGLNVIVSSLLYYRHPSELKFVFIDPKMVEFSAYAGLLHHYLAVLPSGDKEEEAENAIVKMPKDAEKTLRSLCIEMDDRYQLLSKAGVNNIKLYNQKYKDRKLNPEKGHRFLPYIVAVIDEYADLTMMTGASPEARAAARSITNSVIRLAQKGRAAGLHVILATQRPSVDVISGVIKSNFPMRIAFRVASRVDSQTILDAPGAEKLIGKGDMLFSAGIDSERIQCGYVSGEEIEKVTSFISSQTGYGRCYSAPYHLPAPPDATGEAGGASIDMTDLDDRFAEAARLVVNTQRGSTSDLQRKLGMGYAKAGRVMDQLEAAGIVGEQQGSKPRQVLISDPDELEEIIKKYMK
ncbi:MAG: DNA translocase FtsK [Bacteroidales bacterium]|nr:DNA translocase FtsK [Bacteroidales bacterium]